jgi:hypothetical protein
LKGWYVEKRKQIKPLSLQILMLLNSSQPPWCNVNAATWVDSWSSCHDGRASNANVATWVDSWCSWDDGCAKNVSAAARTHSCHDARASNANLATWVDSLSSCDYGCVRNENAATWDHSLSSWRRRSVTARYSCATLDSAWSVLDGLQLKKS